MQTVAEDVQVRVLPRQQVPVHPDEALALVEWQN